MKIERLKIHNIASIEDADIDFTSTPLHDCGVFLICGDTGAGKSTILDCICLALYGTVPRLENSNMSGEMVDVKDDKITLKDARQLMRRGTGHCDVELIFKGTDGHRYKVIWSVKRAHKRIDGKLQTRVWAVFDADTDKLLGEKRETAEIIKKAIDLDFDQFCRTTMLAQGEFNKFLDSKDDEKSAILEKILGDTIYTKVGKRIYEVANAKKSEVAHLQELMDNVELLSDDERQSLSNIIASLSLNYSELEKNRTAWINKHNWLVQRKQLDDEQTKVAHSLQGIRQKIDSDEFKAKRQFESDWQEASKLRQLTQHLAQYSARLTKEQAGEAELSRDFAALKMQYRKMREDKTALEQQRDMLFTTRKFPPIALDAPEYIAPKDVNNRDAENNWIQLMHDWIKQRVDKNTDTKLTEVVVQKGRVLKLIEIRTDIAEAHRKREADRKNIKSMRDDLDRATKEYEEAEKAKDIAQKAYDQAHQLYEKQKASIDDWAREMRRTLSPGDNCPVCGAKIVDALPSEEDFDKLIRPIFEDAQEKEKQLKNALTDVHRLNTEIKVKTKNITIAEKKFKADDTISNLSKRALELYKEAKLNEKDTDDYLVQIYEKLKIEETELAKEVRQLKKDTATVDEIDKNYNDRLSRLAQIEAKIVKLNNDIEGCSDSINSILEVRPEWDNIEPVSTLHKVNHLQLLTSVTALNALLKNIASDNDTTKNDIASERASHPDWSNEYTDKLINTSKEDYETIRNEITDTETNLKIAIEKEKDIKHNLELSNGNRPEMSDDTTVDECVEKLNSIAEEMEKKATEKGRNEALLAADSGNRKKVEKYRKSYDKILDDFSRWDTLNNAFGSADGKKFRQIALSFVLHSLIESANIYMARLFPRYSLSIRPGTYTIYVVDSYLDDIQRPVSGISGGESFIVSLALALALSDIGGVIAPDILFIDEGFGSLSGEPLDRAIQTLHTLGSRVGRQVGIISHVQELRQRIPVQIRVASNQPSGASEVAVISEFTDRI